MSNQPNNAHGTFGPQPVADPTKRHPLPIVLTNEQKRRWDEYKRGQDLRDDRTALLRLLTSYEQSHQPALIPPLELDQVEELEEGTANG